MASDVEIVPLWHNDGYLMYDTKGVDTPQSLSFLIVAAVFYGVLFRCVLDSLFSSTVFHRLRDYLTHDFLARPESRAS